MPDRINIPIELSLADPDDPDIVNIVADAIGVGITDRNRATGHRINFTPEFLQQYARTLKGKPINVELKDDSPSGHSTVVVGAIDSAAFDPGTNKVGIIGSLYRHYFPETVARLLELQKDRKLEVSAELSVTESDEEENDTVKPKVGWFGGLGIVDRGAYTGNKVHYLLQAYETDLEAKSLPKTTTEIQTAPEPLAGSFEWVGNQVAEFLANNTTGDPTITGTYTDTVWYTTQDSNTNDRWKVNFKQDGDSLKFGEPEQVSQEEPVTPSVVNPESKGQYMLTEDQIADLQASLKTAQDSATEYQTKFEALETQITTDRANRESERIALARLDEVDQIAPYTDEALKAEHLEIFKTADEKTFGAMKVLLAAAAEPKGGIAPGGKVPTEPETETGEAEALAALPKWREELAAAYPNAVATAVKE